MKITVSTVLSGPGAYFHFIRALAAKLANIGLPALMSTLETLPFGSTVAVKRVW